ncbi:MAG: hypothetical protein KKI08_00010 [Armatimonadetes bacterium]|nr:hypothetical protein [Armatimonadota bacterium]
MSKATTLDVGRFLDRVAELEAERNEERASRNRLTGELALQEIATSEAEARATAQRERAEAAEARVAELEAERDARRDSLAQEIGATLQVRQRWTPKTWVGDSAADLIMAVGRALDDMEAERDEARARVAELEARVAELEQQLAKVLGRVGDDISMALAELRETDGKTAGEIISVVFAVLDHARTALVVAETDDGQEVRRAAASVIDSAQPEAPVVGAEEDDDDGPHGG